MYYVHRLLKTKPTKSWKRNERKETEKKTDWINTYDFCFAGKSDNLFPFSKPEVDHDFREFYVFAVR